MHENSTLVSIMSRTYFGFLRRFSTNRRQNILLCLKFVVISVMLSIKRLILSFDPSQALVHHFTQDVDSASPSPLTIPLDRAKPWRQTKHERSSRAEFLIVKVLRG